MKGLCEEAPYCAQQMAELNFGGELECYFRSRESTVILLDDFSW